VYWYYLVLSISLYRYEFSSNIEDHINDLMQQRDEVRDGLNVKGSYSYSDGYYKRTVHYEADDKGYRVTGLVFFTTWNNLELTVNATGKKSYLWTDPKLI
jgi:hypothetical protein